MGSLPPRTWWKDGTAYQVWPASYKDSNDDGIGDIRGLISSLDYLQDLGIDIIWLSPHYDSPQHDMGYDIRNYEDIYPPYGTLQDTEDLILECHRRGMRIMFDLVINHTSNEHPWFKESRSSKNNPKADWYIWRSPKIVDGKRKPPNNWRAHFGGSAWAWCEERQEYYLHLFLPEQPDLNWENEETRNAIYQSAVKFWLDKGVDGFRVDTCNMYSKPIDFTDAEITDLTSELQFAPGVFCNGPRMHEFFKELHDKVLQYYDCAMCGELPHTPNPKEVLKYVSTQEKELSMVFQFDLVDLGQGSPFRYTGSGATIPEFKRNLALMQDLTMGTDGWSTVFLENHDQARSIPRFVTSDPSFRTRAGKLLSILLGTLTGTLFLYQGQEIGMVNCPESWTASDYRDVETVNYLKMIGEQNPGDADAIQKALSGVQKYSRDNARTPVQWDDRPNAGFTTASVTPWMSANPNFHEINVKRETADPDSILNFWKKMLKVRKQFLDLFVHGHFRILDEEDEHTITFTKEFDSQKALVVLNFSGEERRINWPDWFSKQRCELLVRNVSGSSEDVLEAYEGRAYLVT